MAYDFYMFVIIWIILFVDCLLVVLVVLFGCCLGRWLLVLLIVWFSWYSVCLDCVCDLLGDLCWQLLMWVHLLAFGVSV